MNGFLYQIARRYAARTPTMDVEDFVSVGRIALLRSIETWDPAQGALTTYAHRPVTSYMTKAQLTEGTIVSGIAEPLAGGTNGAGKVKRAWNSGVRDVDELMRVTGCSRATVDAVVRLRGTRDVRLEDVPAGRDEGDHHEAIGSDAPNAEELLGEEDERREQSERMERAMAGLDHRQRHILTQRLQGKTLDEVGRQYNLSRERIRQIEKPAMRKLYARLGMPVPGVLPQSQTKRMGGSRRPPPAARPPTEAAEPRVTEDDAARTDEAPPPVRESGGEERMSTIDQLLQEAKIKAEILQKLSTLPLDSAKAVIAELDAMMRRCESVAAPVVNPVESVPEGPTGQAEPRMEILRSLLAASKESGVPFDYVASKVYAEAPAKVARKNLQALIYEPVRRGRITKLDGGKNLFRGPHFDDWDKKRTWPRQAPGAKVTNGSAPPPKAYPWDTSHPTKPPGVKPDAHADP